MKKHQILYLFVISIIVTTNAVSIYPSHEALNASYEAITNENFSTIDWMIENLDNTSSIIATDHRLARIAESAGFTTTLDRTFIIWEAENLSDYLKELTGSNTNSSGITHIIIDDIMKNKVVHVGFGKITYMTNNSYDKFLKQPFEMIYRNSTLNEELEEEHWTEIFKVNWSYILDIFNEEIFPSTNKIFKER
jgi:hypothetical protein